MLNIYFRNGLLANDRPRLRWQEEVIDVDSDEPQEDAPQWSMQQCITVPGMKHLCDNIQGDIVRKLSFFAEYQSDLSAVNHLLHVKYYRDRLKELYKHNKLLARCFDHHSAGNLIMWRWGSLVHVCDAILKLEGALRGGWSLNRFLKTRTEANEKPEDESGSGTQLFNQADKAIRSPFFWAYGKFILLIQGVLNDISTWAEACPCHGFSKADCCLKGRRAPECAGGIFKTFLDRTVVTAASLFTAVSSGLTEAKKVDLLNREWNCAVDLIFCEIQLKTAQWEQLPWMLCGLALEGEAGRAVGRKVVEMMDCPNLDAMATLGRKHRMTQLFMKGAMTPG